MTGIRFSIALAILFANFSAILNRGFVGFTLILAIIAMSICEKSIHDNLKLSNNSQIAGVLIVYAYVAVISYYQTLKRETNIRAADYREE